jgi:hypothetical protein
MTEHKLNNTNLQVLLKNKRPTNQSIDSIPNHSMKRKNSDLKDSTRGKKRQRSEKEVEPNYNNGVQIGTFSVDVRNTTQELEFKDGNTTYYEDYCRRSVVLSIELLF